MGTVQDRIDKWRKDIGRGESQINNEIALRWYNKGYSIFQKELLDYANGNFSNEEILTDIQEGKETYTLPLNNSDADIKDFYSIIQIKIAYDLDKDGYPLYRICEPINLGDYNVDEQTGVQYGKPYIKDRISFASPKYTFTGKNKVIIYPTPIKDVEHGFLAKYSYIEKEITDSDTNENTLNLPRYFFDAVEDYMSYRLILLENPELAQPYYEAFINTLHRNIYGMTKDQRLTEEEFANLTYFYRN